MRTSAGRRPLDGRVAIVSGGSRGLGKLLGARLAADGAAVGLIARSAADLAATASEITQAGHTAVAVCADVTDERAAAAAVCELRDKLGTADILVNNAGISGPIGPAWQVPGQQWWRAVEVNVGGTFVLTQLALPHMIQKGRGRIINITSYAGVYRWPLLSAYAASKAAVVKLTETLAEETRSHGVAVFSVDPGLLPIGLSEAALSEAALSEAALSEAALSEAALSEAALCEAKLAGAAGRHTPAGRVYQWISDQFEAGRGADPEDAARLVLTLAGGRADRLSGRHLSVADDIEALLARIDEIERADLHTLRLRT